MCGGWGLDDWWGSARGRGSGDAGFGDGVQRVVGGVAGQGLPDTGEGGGPDVAQGLVGQILFAFVQLNLLLAVFNMVPVPPLDGGNVLAGLVSGPVAEAMDRIRPYGILILYALMFLGVFSRIIYPVVLALEDLLL